MTTQEAIEQLKLTRAANECNDADKYILDVFDMAIRSLEAWEKVKEKIEHEQPICYWNKHGLDRALKIIDKHLQEVENEDLINKQRNKYIHIDDVYGLIEGHSNYHGDDILSAFTCLAEGKSVKSINPI